MLKDFYELWPDRFGNVTNGVTPRRSWRCPTTGLRSLLDETIGDGWLTDLGPVAPAGELRRGPGVPGRGGEVKRANKRRLAGSSASTGIELDHTWMFDIQVKRIHEYKRQHLNVLHHHAAICRLRREPEVRDRTACLHLRRQGRARLLHGQADHQG